MLSRAVALQELNNVKATYGKKIAYQDSRRCKMHHTCLVFAKELLCGTWGVDHTFYLMSRKINDSTLEKE